MSKPLVVFTDNELKKIVPHWDESMLTSHRSDCVALFKNLGGDATNGIEVQRELTSRNKFNEIDSSTRYVMTERLDPAWLLSGNSSHEARIYSEDKSLVKEIRGMTKGSKEVKTNNKEND